ncbi:hypothetical protein MPSEU_000565100 [Mayamaea pseudoterrestris]|nr:hypothetical protein MPSEU_000565100 [Mayamaea pseudoterrestris]
MFDVDDPDKDLLGTQHSEEENACVMNVPTNYHGDDVDDVTAQVNLPSLPLHTELSPFTHGDVNVAGDESLANGGDADNIDSMQPGMTNATESAFLEPPAVDGEMLLTAVKPKSHLIDQDDAPKDKSETLDQQNLKSDKREKDDHIAQVDEPIDRNLSSSPPLVRLKTNHIDDDDFEDFGEFYGGFVVSREFNNDDSPSKDTLEGAESVAATEDGHNQGGDDAELALETHGSNVKEHDRIYGQEGDSIGALGAVPSLFEGNVSPAHVIQAAAILSNKNEYSDANFSGNVIADISADRAEACVVIGLPAKKDLNDATLPPREEYVLTLLTGSKAAKMSDDDEDANVDKVAPLPIEAGASPAGASPTIAGIRFDEGDDFDEFGDFDEAGPPSAIDSRTTTDAISGNIGGAILEQHKQISTAFHSSADVVHKASQVFSKLFDKHKQADASSKDLDEGSVVSEAPTIASLLAALDGLLLQNNVYDHKAMMATLSEPDIRPSTPQSLILSDGQEPYSLYNFSFRSLQDKHASSVLEQHNASIGKSNYKLPEILGVRLPLSPKVHRNDKLASTTAHENGSGSVFDTNTTANSKPLLPAVAESISLDTNKSSSSQSAKEFAAKLPDMSFMLASKLVSKSK